MAISPISGLRPAGVRSRAVACLAGALLVGALAAGQSATAQQGPPPAAEARPTLPVRAFTLRNGLRVVVLEQPGVTSFTATFLHQAGVAREWQGLLGAAQLAGEALTDGTTVVGTSNWRQEQRALTELDRIDKDLAAARGEREHAPSPSLQLAADGKIEAIQARFDKALAQHQALVRPDAWADTYKQLGAEGPRVQVGHDAVSYSVTLPAAALGRFLELERQRISDTVPRSFYEDRARLAQALEQGWVSDPAYPVLETLAHTALQSHPYGRYMGSAEQLRGIDRGELSFFLRSFTAPSRTVLAIVGGVDGAAVERLATATLGRVPAGAPPAAELEGAEAPQRGERQALVRRAGPTELLFAFPTGQVGPAQQATLAVLVELLGHSGDGLLAATLSEVGAKGRVSAGLFPAGGPLGPRDAPLLVLGLQLPAADAGCVGEAALRYGLAVLATEGAPEEAVSLAKRRAQARLSGLWSDHTLMAPALAWSELAQGSPRALIDRFDALAQVTPEQVRQLSAQLLDPSQQTTVVGWSGPSGSPRCEADGAAGAP